MTESIYRPFEDFFLRVPIYPVNNFFSLPNEIESVIGEMLENDQFMTALYLGSPNLYKEAISLKENQALAGESKLLRAILKYWLRMSTRPTPFGIFAGNAMGKLHDDTKIIINRSAEHYVHSRVDMYILGLMFEHINRDVAIRDRIKFYPNSSIFLVAGKLRYLEYKLKSSDRIYSIAEVEYSLPLKTIVEGAKNGARISELVSLICDDEIGESEAYEFIIEVINSQVLISELDINVTGTPYMQYLIDKLTDIPEAKVYLSKLKQIAGILNSSPLVKNFEEIKKCVSSMIELPGENPHLIHADLFVSTTSNTLSKSLAQNIVTNFERLFQLLPNSEPNRITQFREKFLERYEHRMVPLMQALDPDIGIGYNQLANPSLGIPGLLDKIQFIGAGSPEREQLSDFSKYINYKLYECFNNGKTEIEITDDDIERFSFKGEKTIPDAMYVKGALIEDSNSKSRKIMFEFKDFNPSSTATLIGRFCHGREEFANKVLQYSREEESFNKDAIWAEVAHVNNIRQVNISARPLLRDFEIPYLSNSVVSNHFKIYVDDLYLRVVKKEIILWSKRLNKQVIPKLTSAHNFRTGVPGYTFLCDLQFQNLYYDNFFRWSEINESLPFLPSVIYKNVIITKARWKIRHDGSKALSKSPNDELLTYFKELSTRLKLPRFVIICQGDNDMPIDMHNIHCLRILAEQMIRTHEVVLREFSHTPENCVVKDVNGLSFSNEVVIPMTKAVKNENREFHNKVPNEVIQRHFVAGSEWLYVKIFCGIKAAENLLIESIKPFIDSLIKRQVIDQWFFVRYTLPDNHLRIRFHGKGMFWSKVIEEFNLLLYPKIAQGSIDKYAIDTYVREIERYGSDTMLAGENFFHVDSDAVLSFLDVETTLGDESLRWIFGLRGVDALLDDFGLDLTAKKRLLNMVRDGFFKEFKGDKQLKVQLDIKYREEMKKIARYMNKQNDSLTEFEMLVPIIKKRSKQMYSVVSDVKKYFQNEVSIKELIASYIHMFLNRLFASNHRKQELVLYHMLSKYYESQLAMAATQSRPDFAESGR